MSAVETEHAPARGHGIKSSLTRKLGPLPVWVWGIAGGATIALVIRARRGSSSASSSTATPTGTSGLDTSGAGFGGGVGGGGSGSGGGSGGYLDPGPTAPILDQSPPPIPTYVFNIQTQAPAPVQTQPTSNQPLQNSDYWQYQPGADFQVDASIVQAAADTAYIDSHPVILTDYPQSPDGQPHPGSPPGPISSSGPSVNLNPPSPPPKPNNPKVSANETGASAHNGNIYSVH